MKMLMGPFLFLARVFTFKKQFRTVILPDFIKIHRGRPTLMQPRSSAPELATFMLLHSFVFTFYKATSYPFSLLHYLLHGARLPAPARKKPELQISTRSTISFQVLQYC